MEEKQDFNAVQEMLAKMMGGKTAATNKPRSNDFQGVEMRAIDTADGNIDPHLTPTVLKSGKESLKKYHSLSVIEKEIVQSQKPHEGNTIQAEHSSLIKNISKNIWFRQSMISDYMTCPLMMMFKWVMGLPQDKAWPAAFLGTAGHKVVEEIHKQRNFEMGRQDIQSIFCEEYEIAVKRHLKETNQPEEGVSNFNVALMANLEDYTDILNGYQRDEVNRQFNCTVMEQDFVCVVYDEQSKPYIFTGTIDQMGYENNGNFHLRDMKFRAKQFKPSHFEVHLSSQLALYSFAAVFGNPCCDLCRPKQGINSNGFLEIKYDGPCVRCKRKIGGPSWPRLLPSVSSLIWMKDYISKKKDEFAKMIKDPQKKQVFNEETKRMRIREVVNPEWFNGYKKGDQDGPVHIRSIKTLEFLKVQIADMMRITEQISSGNFYRRPGEHCHRFCPYKDQCRDGLESKVAELVDLNILDNVIENSNSEPF